LREICINILRNIDKDEEEKIVQNILTSIVKLICTWKQINYIDSVKADRNYVNPTGANICEWISKTKVVGSDKQQTYNFITVNTMKGFGELING